MSPPSVHAEYRPRWHRTRMSTYWWLKRRSYLTFITRELTSVFIAWAVVFLLFLVRAVSGGDASYRAFLDWAAAPAILLLNVVTLVFVVFHAVTWFNLAPQALAVRIAGRRVPGGLIAASNYAAWAVASALVAYLVLGAS